MSKAMAREEEEEEGRLRGLTTSASHSRAESAAAPASTGGGVHDTHASVAMKKRAATREGRERGRAVWMGGGGWLGAAMAAPSSTSTLSARMTTGTSAEEAGPEVNSPFQLTEVGEPGTQETTSARVELARLSALMCEVEQHEARRRGVETRTTTSVTRRSSDLCEAGAVQSGGRRDALVRRVAASLAHVRQTFRLRVAELPGQQESVSTPVQPLIG